MLHDGDSFATGQVMEDVRFEDCLRDAAQPLHDGAPSKDIADGRLRAKA